MTVYELKRALEDLDDDAEVRIMMQPNWPFECSLSGVTTAQDIERNDDEEAPDCGWCDHSECPECGGQSRPVVEEKDFDGDIAPANRVFLVEGRQLRYGNRNAWANV